MVCDPNQFDRAKPPTHTPFLVNSITFGMTKTIVYFSQEPYLCPMMNPVNMTSTGMSARLIERFLTPHAWMDAALIVVRAIRARD